MRKERAWFGFNGLYARQKSSKELILNYNELKFIHKVNYNNLHILHINCK
jgi:hypothetical protein